MLSYKRLSQSDFGIRKRTLRCVIALLVILLNLSAFSIHGCAYNNIPDNVRIGLYYTGSRSENGAVDSVTIHSASGLRFGYSDSAGQFVVISDFELSNPDSSFKIEKKKADLTYKVCVTAEKQTFADTRKLVASLNKAGYEADVAYLEHWSAIVGAFASEKKAEQLIDSELKKNFKDCKFSTYKMSGKYLSVSLDKNSLFIYDTASGNFRFSPRKNLDTNSDAAEFLQLNNKKYRGSIELIRNDNSDMTIVNVLGMNEYLYGVVPMEIQALSDMEAIKAQAVAARTYTLNSMSKHKEHGFDLCTTQDCQVYGGASNEHERSNQAVDDTDDEIITWNNEPALVFYFSSSGGATEDVKNVWGSEYPYLKSVQDPYESGNSSNYHWETVYTAKQIQSQLEEKGENIGSVRSIMITKLSEAGRVAEIMISGSKGVKIYKNEACRLFLRNLSSQMYIIAGNGQFETVDGAGKRSIIQLEGKKTIAAESNGSLSKKSVAVSASGIKSFPAVTSTFRFIGKGWGHGVGMSQEGAKGMAIAGFRYDEILKHYFTGCEIK